MVHTVDFPHPSFMPGMTNHTIPSTTNHSISPNERTALAITRQQRKISGTRVIPSQESSHPLAAARSRPSSYKIIPCTEPTGGLKQVIIRHRHQNPSKVKEGRCWWCPLS